MRKREILKQNAEFKKSLRAQFIVIYGIMVGMSLVSILATVTKWPNVTRADIESIFVNAFVPTTITIFATALFEYDFVRNNKETSAIYIVFTVAMSLFYTVFVCFEVLLGVSVITTITAATAEIITIVAFITLFYMAHSFDAKVGPRYPAVSDGCISATRRK